MVKAKSNYWRGRANKRRVAKTKNSKAITKVVNKVLNRKIELKNTYESFTELSINTLSPTSYFNIPKEMYASANAGGRMADKITVKGIHIKGELFNNSTTDTVYTRAVLLQYTRPDLGTSSLTSSNLIFDTSSTQPYSSDTAWSGNIGTLSITAPLAKGTGCKVLYDKTFKLSPNVTGNSGTQSKMLNKFVKLNTVVRFSTISSEITSSYPRYVCGMWSSLANNDDTGGGQAVEFTGFTRLFYQDI